MNHSKCSNLYEIVKLVEEQTQNGRLELNAIKGWLNDQMRIRTVPPKTAIARKENRGKYVYYIISGKYFHYRISKQGRMNYLSNECAPQWLDIGNVIAAQYANETEDKTLEECIVLDIRADYFIQCVKESGEFATKIIENLLIKMALISRESDRRLLADARERMLLYILQSWKTEQHEMNFCVIDEKNEAIADAIGISIRSLYRILNQLKSEGLIEVKKEKSM